MPRPIELSGEPASPGFASGPVYLAHGAETSRYTPLKTVDAEIDALNRARQEALERLQNMVDALDAEAAAILEFQLAMVADDTLFEDAFAFIREGSTADAAWTKALNREISGYAASEDEYFRARAADLADIRDRVRAALTGSAEDRIPVGAICVADDISPTRFLEHDWSEGGLVLRGGSATSHVSMLAKSRGVPAIVGIGETPIPDGALALLDASEAHVIVAPDNVAVSQFQRKKTAYSRLREAAAVRAHEVALTADGEKVDILVNIARPEDVETIPIDTVDGVGLMRTEFLFGGTQGLPDEESQYQAYRTVLTWAHGKPVTIRTVDAGGDKPIAGLSEAEDNAFLGVRGIRLSLRKPDIFRVQIRALLRASRHGNLRIMLPMISVPEEVASAVALFRQEADSLAVETVPAIGVMVEVPSVAICPQRFASAAFFSIGSNDLTQYVLAVSRDNTTLSGMASTGDPAVLALIERVVAVADEAGKEASLCGDAASDPALVPLLLAAGLRKLSVAAAQVGVVKAAVRGWRRDPGTATG